MAISKVLVVDDAEVDRLHLQTILTNAGYHVITASSGSEAIDKASDSNPDLVLLDIIMDGMDGFKACRRLTSEPATKHIPVIMVSGNSQKVDKIWARRQGAQAYITKPYTAQQVIAEIQRLSVGA
ncbi:MAG: response regulator [Gammaproteobacteria bacterium]